MDRWYVSFSFLFFLLFFSFLFLVFILYTVSYAQQSKVSSVYKILAFIPKLDSLTHEEFKNYYETQHAPFVFATLGYLPACDKPVFYKRNFMAPGQPSPYSNLDASYDVVTEFAFASKANFDVSVFLFFLLLFLLTCWRTSWLQLLNTLRLGMTRLTSSRETKSNWLKLMRDTPTCKHSFFFILTFLTKLCRTTYSCSASCSATVRAVPREGSSWAADGKVWQVYDLAITNTGNQQVTGVKFSLDGGVIESSWNIALSSGQWSADLFGCMFFKSFLLMNAINEFISTGSW